MTSDPPPARLAAGVRAVPRGRDRLQVGIVPGGHVVVPALSPEGEAVRTLQHGRRLTRAQRGLGVLEEIGDAGLLAPPATPGTRTVSVLGALGRADVRRALAAAGLRQHVSAGAPGLLLAEGEPEREVLDPWLREGRPHLVVRVVDGTLTVGPFVLPGAGACMRCIDAHRQDADPEYVAVLHRYIHQPRLDGHDDTAPGAEAALALAWAARDLATWLDGRRPITLSTTVALCDDGFSATTWRRHPECACSRGPAPENA